MDLSEIAELNNVSVDQSSACDRHNLLDGRVALSAAIFVYHAGVGPGAQSETFKTMERKLLHFIMVPAMLLSWITGVTLAVHGAHFHAFWFHSNMLAVVR